MALSDTMRWMGRSARYRAQAMSHQMKDRALSGRLDRAAEENDRLRTENRTLKDTVEEVRADHERILALLEHHADEVETEDERGSHKGRWFMFLMLLAGGAWAWMKNRTRDMELMDRGRPIASGETLGGMTSAA